MAQKIAAEGGRKLDGPCMGREIDYTDGRERTAHCGNESRFDVPYGAREPARVCAVDDRMDLWPRFAV